MGVSKASVTNLLKQRSSKKIHALSLYSQKKNPNVNHKKEGLELTLNSFQCDDFINLCFYSTSNSIETKKKLTFLLSRNQDEKNV